MMLFGVMLAVVLAAVIWAWWFTRRLQKFAESRLPAVGEFVEVDGARLHYLDRGEVRGGPPIVMLHGLAGQLHNFAYGLVDELARDTRVIAVDRPGSGYSTRQDGRVRTLIDQADAIEDLCRHLDLGRVLFVGHSLGGALSLTLMLRHPSRVAGLALIAPLTTLSGRIPDVFARLNIGSDWLRKAVAAVLATPMLILSRDRVMPQIFGPEQVPADYPIKAGGILSLRTSQFVSASQDFCALPAVMPQIESRYEDLCTTNTPPIGILYGRGDLILDPKAHGDGFVARVPATRLVVVDGGHMLPVTQPDLCATFVRECWQQARTTS